MRRSLGISERRACRVLGQPRQTQRYRPIIKEQERRLVERMLALVRAHPRYGYRRIWALLKREGGAVNRKRVYRLWRREGLKVPQKARKKRHVGHSANACARRRAEHPDHVWAWDFIFDRTTSGRSLKWLSIVDEYTRECLALVVARSLTAQDVLDVLAEFVRGAWRGRPFAQRQWPGVHCPSVAALVGVDGCQDLVHRAGGAVGERLRGIVPQSVAR